MSLTPKPLDTAQNVPSVIKYLLENLHRKAQHTLTHENGSVEPVLFFFRTDKENSTGVGDNVALLPIGPLMTSSVGKNAVREIMEDAIRQPNIDIVIMVSEAWMAKLNAYNREEALAVRVSERPDRIEVVLFNVMTKNKQYVGSAEIIRQPTGVTLEEIEIFVNDDTDELEGTLVRERKPTAH